jgi:Cu-processing system ATP-binding protein
MIDIQNLCKTFGKLEALKNVNLHCQSGQSIALIGPNGCGKTTLIKSILSMVIPDKGEILFSGKNIKGDYKYRTAIGYMPQIGRYPENMNVGQVIQTMQQLRGEAASALDQDLYEAYKLKDILHKRMATLSGGTRQKVSAYIAFMFNPQVLILDEPTAGLDPLAAEILKEKINVEKQKDKLILITSHLLSELDELVSELIFMQEGEVVFHKNTALLKSDMNENTISKAISKVLRAQLAQ